MNQFKYPIGEHFVFESSIDTFVLEHGINVDDLNILVKLWLHQGFKNQYTKLILKKK